MAAKKPARPLFYELNSYQIDEIRNVNSHLLENMPDHNPSVSLQGTDDLFLRQAGNLAQTATSMSSALGAKSQSSSLGSR